MVKIRLMDEEDAAAVRQVDALAFWAWAKEVKGERASMFRRTLTNILIGREKDPEGCFVAEREGQVIGFIFSRTWGVWDGLAPSPFFPNIRGKV